MTRKEAVNLFCSCTEARGVMETGASQDATSLCANIPLLRPTPAATGTPPAQTQAPGRQAAGTLIPTPPKPVKPVKATAQQRAEAERMSPLARSAFWAHEVDVDGDDAEARLKLAKSLRKQIMTGLTRRGMSRRQAEEALELDVRDLQVDIRRSLAQESPAPAFSKKTVEARVREG